MENKDTIDKPHIVIDNSLKKYKDVVLCPEKLAKANEMLRTVGLPKAKSERKA